MCHPFERHHLVFPVPQSYTHFLASPMSILHFFPPFKSLLYTFSCLFCLCLNFPHFRRTVQKQGAQSLILPSQRSSTLKRLVARHLPSNRSRRHTTQRTKTKLCRPKPQRECSAVPINQVRGSCVYSPSSVWCPLVHRLQAPSLFRLPRDI